MKRFKELGRRTKEIKQGKKERVKKDKESEITRGQKKRGLLCMCINRVYDEVGFCVVCSDSGQRRQEREGGGEINGKLHSLCWPIVQYDHYILKKALPR